jgi:hypothetical protein
LVSEIKSAAEVTTKFKRYLFASNATYYDEPVALESGKGCYAAISTATSSAGS